MNILQAVAVIAGQSYRYSVPYVLSPGKPKGQRQVYLGPHRLGSEARAIYRVFCKRRKARNKRAKAARKQNRNR